MEPTVTLESAQRTLHDIYAAGWVVTALSLGVERGLLAALSAETPREAAELGAAAGLSCDLAGSVLDVLAGAGLVVSGEGGYRASAGLAALLAGPTARLLRADLRSMLGVQQGTLLRARDPGATIEGWHADDPIVVDAQGTASQLLTLMINRDFLPRIDPALVDGLTREGARLLDVGAGSAGGCVGFCAGFPGLRVVGIEPAPLPFEMALRRIREANLSERIEMRMGGIESIDEQSVYDAAYVAQMFIPTGPLVDGLRRVRAALKPGGILFTVATAASGPDLQASTSRLRSSIWGGGARTKDDVRALLDEAGFVKIRAVPLPGGTMTPVVARRAQA